ncbi:MAG: AsnC family transcriptional regulator [Halodesulfurarchaeum sp.]
MNDLDDIDRQILELLVEDARRPYRDIAETVNRSPPAVSDRIDRLEKQGVIRGFTTHLDHQQLREGTPILVELSVRPDAVRSIREGITDIDAVEHLFVTVDDTVFFQANAPGDVSVWLDRVLEHDGIRSIDVSLLSDTLWSPSIGPTEFGLVCDECGNTVTSEGVTTRLGDEVKQFCCPSCEQRYLEHYEKLRAEAREDEMGDDSSEQPETP